MNKTLKIDYKVIKAFNNNIVLTEHDKKEIVIFGKGIGFGKKGGEKILAGTQVDKIFKIEDEENIKNFNRVMEYNDPNLLAFGEELILYVSEELEEELNEKIHAGLIEHISFALKRIKSGEFIENPFIVEIETLYPLEYKLAKNVVKRLGEYADLNIPEGEAGFIAIHIHSARNDGKISNTVKCGYIANAAADIIEKYLNVKIDKKSYDYGRFISHLRYAIERTHNDIIVKNDLLLTIKRKYKESFKIANEIGVVMENALGKKVSQDELGYLTIHIERFKTA